MKAARKSFDLLKVTVGYIYHFAVVVEIVLHTVIQRTASDVENFTRKWKETIL
jgi:hypothetical protein